MKRYDKIKEIYSELTNENYKFTKELNEKLKEKVLEALKLKPQLAIRKLAKLLEEEKEGNKLMYAAAFYKKLKEAKIEEVSLVSMPYEEQKKYKSDISLIDYDYTVLLDYRKPMVMCPTGRAKDILMNVKDLKSEMLEEYKICEIYDMKNGRTLSELLKSPVKILKIQKEYKDTHDIPERDLMKDEPDITYEQYKEDEKYYNENNNQEKEEFLAEEDFKENKIRHDKENEEKEGIKQIDKVFELQKKYTNNKYQFEENVDLTKRQQKEIDDILISNPNEALEKCYEYLENYRRGNSLIYAGAILHLLLKNNIEGYIGHLTLGQKIEDYTNSMLEYEDFYPIIKLKNSNEYYVIMALGGEQIDYDNLQEVMLKNGKLGRFLPYEDEYSKVAKLKDLLTPETKMAINKFTPDNTEKEKTLGELLRTKEITIDIKEKDNDDYDER